MVALAISKIYVSQVSNGYKKILMHPPINILINFNNFIKKHVS